MSLWGRTVVMLVPDKLSAVLSSHVICACAEYIFRHVPMQMKNDNEVLSSCAIVVGMVARQQCVKEEGLILKKGCYIVIKGV